MKLRLGLLTAFVAAGALAYGLFSKSPAPKTPEGAPSALPSAVLPTALPPSPREIHSLRRLLSRPMSVARRPNVRISPACRAFETALLGVSLDSSGRPGERVRLPSPRGCRPTSARVARLFDHYVRACGHAKWTTGDNECEFALITVRATLAILSRETKPIETMNDLGELADILVAELGELETTFSPTVVERLMAAADRMAELDGRLESAVKAGAMAAALAEVMKKTAREKDGDGPAADWDAVEARIRRLEELNPADPDLDSLRRLSKTEGMTPELVREDSLERLRRNPDDPREQEILAWANWRLGRRGDSMRILAEALRRNPADASIRANWEVAKNPAAKAEDFKISIQVGVHLSEILR